MIRTILPAIVAVLLPPLAAPAASATESGQCP
jgi:hypothetical protein